MPTRTRIPLAMTLSAAVASAALLTAAPHALAEPQAHDGERNIHVPAQADLTRTLKVAVLYNADKVQIRYEYPREDPSWYHDVYVYEDGEWVHYDTDFAGPAPNGFYEDRISIMIGDGSVNYFGSVGGFVTAHEGMRSLSSAVHGEAVQDVIGESDVRKYIPESREDGPFEASWDRPRSDDEIRQLREDGVFLDLIQWRAHRSNPMGVADNGYVLEYRHGSEGRSMFTTNFDSDAGHPEFMFDPDKTGMRALDWERLLEQGYGQDDLYYLAEEHATAFDPEHEWEDGDTIPRRLLREPSGSRGAVAAEGRHEDGAWRVRITRTLDAPNPMDSKSLEDGGLYNVGFAVHESASARWHYVSLPLTLGLENPQGNIVARRVEGSLDDAEAQWYEVDLLYPNQITWQWLTDGNKHRAANFVRRGMSVYQFHTFDGLYKDIVESELRNLGKD